jgi:hypothetical protein
MSALATIIAGAAAKVGAELVGNVVGGIFGPTGGQLAETVVTSVAEKLGVEPEAIPSVPDDKLNEAVLSVEADMPEKIALWAKALEGQFELQLAEMDKGGATWTWAWRPAGMWLSFVYWTWIIVVVPVINLMLRLFGVSESLVMIVDVATLLTLTITYYGFYMGGHTAKDLMAKWKSGSK